MKYLTACLLLAAAAVQDAAAFSVVGKMKGLGEKTAPTKMPPLQASEESTLYTSLLRFFKGDAMVPTSRVQSLTSCVPFLHHSYIP